MRTCFQMLIFHVETMRILRPIFFLFIYTPDTHSTVNKYSLNITTELLLERVQTMHTGTSINAAAQGRLQPTVVRNDWLRVGIQN